MTHPLETEPRGFSVLSGGSTLSSFRDSCQATVNRSDSSKGEMTIVGMRKKNQKSTSPESRSNRPTFEVLRWRTKTSRPLLS
jgi:hypothetical protein